MDNYSILWDPNVPLPSGAEIEPLANVRLSTVKPYDPYLDGYQFHHGAAIYQYGATLYVSYAVNKRKENTAGETVLVQTSADRGATWSAPEIMAPPPSGTGYSHGEFIACDGTLWALHAQFGDNPFPPPPGRTFYNRFRGLRTCAWTLDEARAGGSRRAWWPTTSGPTGCRSAWTTATGSPPA